MRAGFWSSREFVIGLIVALLIVAGAVTALAGAFGPAFDSGSSGCFAADPAGTRVDVAPQTASKSEGGRFSRTLTFTLDSSSAARLEACAPVGDVTVGPSSDGKTRVIVTFESRSGAGERAVGESVAHVTFARSGERLGVAVWETARKYSTSLFGQSTVHADVRVELPDQVAHDVRASTDVGDATVRGLMLSDLKVQTDVGDARVSSVDLSGNATVITDVGDVSFSASSVATGSIVVKTDVGDATLDLPQRADVGYRVRASADVGAASVEIGPAQNVESTHSTPSESVRKESKDYESKPAKVIVNVDADVGDVAVRAV